MPDLVGLLRRLADEYEKEESGESSKATEERIAALEAQLSKAPKEDREEAIEELSDDEWQLVREHRAARETPAPEPEPEPDDEPEDEPKPKMRRGRKRGQVYQDGKGELGYVYQGDDEPELVPVDEKEAAA